MCAYACVHVRARLPAWLHVLGGECVWVSVHMRMRMGMCVELLLGVDMELSPQIWQYGAAF